jgi:hypothetical protein
MCGRPRTNRAKRRGRCGTAVSSARDVADGFKPGFAPPGSSQFVGDWVQGGRVHCSDAEQPDDAVKDCGQAGLPQLGHQTKFAVRHTDFFSRGTCGHINR